MKKIVVTCLLLLSVTAMGTVNVSALSDEATRNGVPSLAPMLEGVTPAVVNISTTQAARVPEQLRFFNENDLRRFFSDPSNPLGEPSQRGPVRASGSGVIVDADAGFVITNHHVIANADTITVSLQDGREFKAKLLGSDAGTDVALLQIEADNLRALDFADISNLRVGDYVVAIGNPFGIGQTVTSGIVSALGRGGLNNQNYEDFIQTDAAINVGNSGGALVDLEGRLIGINTAIISGSGSNAGIAFAVPVDMISAVMEHLQRDGEVRRGQLGVQIQDLNSLMEETLRTGAGKGALVTNVLPGSAAEAAGIEVSDVIVEIDGRKVESGRELRNIVGLMRVDKEVQLVLYRNGSRETLTATIGGESRSVAANDGESTGRRLDEPVFNGAQLRTFDPTVAAVQSAGVRGGVEVVEVDQQSPAFRAGLRPGDIIYEVNRNSVGNLREFNQTVSEPAPVTALGVIRENRRMLIILS
ncbi:MAG: Do family serine endopeptidase [Gammaproteobacteria bacterium]|nr:Do family serine endopeptidase [Gammaproteobacteria bacterium]MDP2139437.1 Do family serine endopeptidase [Gammaproteobacteria bacterium]MDP2346273.1 Do family serine endopeptidase [Gammaproteobacteria bacterium]